MASTWLSPVRAGPAWLSLVRHDPAVRIPVRQCTAVGRLVLVGPATHGKARHDGRGIVSAALVTVRQFKAGPARLGEARRDESVRGVAAARHGVAGKVWRGPVWRGQIRSRRGMVRLRAAGLALAVRHSKAGQRLVPAALAWRGWARSGGPGLVEAGPAGFGLARPGTSWVGNARPCAARRGWQGGARDVASYCMANPGKAGHGRRGSVVTGTARLAQAWRVQ